MAVSAVCSPGVEGTSGQSSFIENHTEGNELAVQIQGIVRSIWPQLAGQLLYQAERDQIADYLLQSLFRDIVLQKPNHIIIRVKDCNGFGDILFGLKLTDEIVKNLPGIKVAIVFEKQETMDKALWVASEYPYLKNCYLCEDLPEEFKNPDNGLCIGAATFWTKSSFEFTRMGLNEKYKYISLPEYAFQNGHEIEPECFLTTGVRRYDYGIFIERKMVEIEEADFQYFNDPVYHVNELSDETLKSDILKGRAIEDYSNTTNLYFGYGHQTLSHKHFIRSVAHLEKNGPKDVDLVLVIDEPSELEDIVALDLSFQKELVELGFGKIEILQSNNNRAVSIPFSSDAPSKTLRIIPRKKLTHQDIETSLLMSQKLSLATGDQSLSEAISARKIFIYELYLHKVGLDRSLRQLAIDLNLPLIADFLSKVSIPVKDVGFQNEDTKEYQSHSRREASDYDLMAKSLLDPEFNKQWDSFLEHIYKYRSLNAKIIPLVLRLLASNYIPNLSGILKDLWR